MAKQKPTGLQKEGKNQLCPPVYQKKKMAKKIVHRFTKRWLNESSPVYQKIAKISSPDYQKKMS